MIHQDDTPIPWYVRYKGVTALLILVGVVLTLRLFDGTARPTPPANSAEYDAALASCKEEGARNFFAIHPSAYDDASIVDAHHDEIIADLNRCLIDRLGVDAKNVPADKLVAP